MATTSRARKDAPQPDIEVVDAPRSPEHELVAQDGDRLRAFMGGMTKFFTRALEIEGLAKEQLMAAKALTPPTTADEDLTVQNVIRNAKITRRMNDEHWSITSVVSQLHKKLVAGRERAGQMLDEASNLAQQHHNRYVREAEQKARAEQARLRHEAEEAQRLVREAELLKMEREAVTREESSPELSEREELFVDFYLHSGNAESAASRAGYKDAMKSAVRLIGSPKIQAAVKAKQDAAALRQQASAKRAAPVIVDVPPVKADVARAAGSFDRSTYSAEVYDVDAFLAAALDPRTRTQLGIPASVLTFSQPAMNDCAKSLKELIDRWPGVRAVKKTTTV